MSKINSPKNREQEEMDIIADLISAGDDIMPFEFRDQDNLIRDFQDIAGYSQGEAEAAAGDVLLRDIDLCA